MLKLAWFVLVLVGASGTLTAATALRLDIPVSCDVGKTCWIQNYVDHEADPQYKDYACGYLTYDGHKGTDFRVADESVMAQGVPVIAAAPGVVLGVRDGEPDLPISVRGESSLAGKDAGNGVVIDHGNGWQTQYSHLRKGSVAVQRGQAVERGALLGMIGESGNAEFPHVDFSVRHQGRPVDPFLPNNDVKCVPKMGEEALWSESAKLYLIYRPSAILQIGFSDHIPTRMEAQTGKLAGITLYPDQDQIVFWSQLMGVRDGDRWQMVLVSPNGIPLVQASETIKGNKAVWVGGVGKRRTKQIWPKGMYVGQIKLIRLGKVVLEQKTSTELR